MPSVGQKKLAFGRSGPGTSHSCLLFSASLRNDLIGDLTRTTYAPYVPQNMSSSLEGSGKTPGRPVDPGANWSLEKLILLAVVTLGSFLIFIYFVSPTLN